MEPIFLHSQMHAIGNRNFGNAMEKGAFDIDTNENNQLKNITFGLI